MELPAYKICTITKYSHFFSITEIELHLHKYIVEFCLHYVIRTMVRVDPKRPPVLKITTTFASRLKNASEYRLHIGQLKLLLTFLRNKHINIDHIEYIEKDVYTPMTIDIKMRDHWILKEEQKEAESFILDVDPRDNRSRLLTMPTGTGKAQPLDAPIKISGGWTTMGEVKLGDTITAWDGEPTLVNGVFPQGSKDIYRITFSDGRTAECCEDHLWKIYSSLNSEAPYVIIDTKKLLTKGDYSYIPLIIPEKGEDIKLPNDPFLLGKRLGEIRLHKNVYISEIYFNGSLKQRLHLLNGILRTGGTYCDDNTILFISKSQLFTEGVQQLVRSLGGIAELVLINYVYHYDKIEESTYQVNIRLPFIKGDQYVPGLRLRVNKIEKIGKKESQCISIDHPDKLYVTNDYVVTHNTVTSVSAASKFKNRILIIVLAKYLDKWASDVKGILDIEDKDIVTIQGTDSLRSVINLAKDNEFNYKCTIMSLTTIVNFIKQFENDFYGSLEEFDCEPHELYELLSIGVIIFDEAHEHLYSVFKTLTYAHVPKTIALSATFMSRDPMIDKMQQIMFPKEMRFDKIKMKKYIRVHAVSYSFKDFQQAKIRTSEFRSSTYSHTAFEKSILKNVVKSKNYLRMIKDIVYASYIKDYKQGDKLLIFASTKIFCRKLCEYLKESIPEYDIRTYIEEDPYENIMESDITVSTLLSSGTALDIPNLRACVLTVSIDSPTSNLQAIGRLRELKDRDVKYYYLYCKDIKKQVKYHQSRRELFRDRVLSISDIFYPTPI